MATERWDAIVIGAGHNSLVAASALAHAGRRVLVLERRAEAGGQLAQASFADGTRYDPLHAGARLRPDIVRELGLAKHGLTTARTHAPCVSLLPDGSRLALVSEPNHADTIAQLKRHSAKDAARWPEFVAYMDRAAHFLDAAYRTPMPRLPNVRWSAEGAPLAALAWRLRRLGRRDMFRFIRMLSMSALEFTDEWFESEPVKAMVAALAIHGHTLGSMSAGTGYTLAHNWLNRGGLAHAPGGSAAAGSALAAALAANGGTLRASAAVERVLVDRQRASGVRLATGEELEAAVVLSGADPRTSLLGLVGARELPPELVWQAQSIKLRGAVAKVHALTDGKHGVGDGTFVVAPGIKYLERAFDASKYGEVSSAPYLEVTASGNVVSIHFQFAPYALRRGDWAEAKARVERLAVDTLKPMFPALEASIRELRTITPPELESEYGLAEGDMNHGQLILDQMFFMRPIPGWSNHRTPVDGFWLCGAGVHGGGGISGASGRNAARALLKAT